jgi:hypothetical protein
LETIDALIESRAKGKQNGHSDADQVREDLWASSVRAYRLRKQENLRVAWAEFHAGQAARHRRGLSEWFKTLSPAYQSVVYAEGGITEDVAYNALLGSTAKEVEHGAA